MGLSPDPRPATAPADRSDRPWLLTSQHSCRFTTRRRYQTYSRRFASTLTGFGGRLLVADDQPDVLSGDWPYDKFVLLHFASPQAATAWSSSDTFRRIARDRDAAATTTALMLEARRGLMTPNVLPTACSGEVGDLHANVLTYVKAIEAFNRDDLEMEAAGD
jgi:uncharacterized protein (DUF1330 family)